MLELRRNAFHLVFGCILALIIYSIGKTEALLMLAGMFLIGLFVSELLVRKVKLPVISLFIRHFERKKVRPGKGALGFVLGCFLCLFFFPSYVAFVSALILAFEDSFSTVFGKLYGKTKLRLNKTLEGAIAGFMACFAVTVFLLPLNAALAACFAAAVTEFFAFIDDNILIPVTTSAVIYLMMFSVL